MQVLRRQILQCSLGLPLCLPSVLAAKNNAELKSINDINFVEIKDNVASPLLNTGDYMLVDTSVSNFQGEGVYLYPDWGQPRAYEIKEEKDKTLGFYYPGQHDKLWSMTVESGKTLFSGRGLKVMSFSSLQQRQDFIKKNDVLLVPEYPV